MSIADDINEWFDSLFYEEDDIERLIRAEKQRRKDEEKQKESLAKFFSLDIICCPQIKGINVGYQIGKNICVAPEVYESIQDKDTFQTVIENLKVIQLKNQYKIYENKNLFKNWERRTEN